MKTGSARGSLGVRAGPRTRPDRVWSLEAASELGRGRHAPAPGAPGDGEPVGETVGGARAPTAPGGADRPRPGVARIDRRETAAGPEQAPASRLPPVRGPGGSSRRSPEEFSGEPERAGFVRPGATPCGSGARPGPPPAAERARGLRRRANPSVQVSSAVVRTRAASDPGPDVGSARRPAYQRTPFIIVNRRRRVLRIRRGVRGRASNRPGVALDTRRRRHRPRRPDGRRVPPAVDRGGRRGIRGRGRVAFHLQWSRLSLFPDARSRRRGPSRSARAGPDRRILRARGDRAGRRA